MSERFSVFRFITSTPFKLYNVKSRSIGRSRNNLKAIRMLASIVVSFTLFWCLQVIVSSLMFTDLTQGPSEDVKLTIPLLKDQECTFSGVRGRCPNEDQLWDPKGVL
nr:hypothetical protein BgiMline_017618 [Biomphalaria glabrata]